MVIDILKDPTFALIIIAILSGCTSALPGAPPPQPPDAGADPARAQPYLPDLDFDRDDVYGSGRVVRVASTAELERAVTFAAPFTTIVLADGVFDDVHVVVPRGAHHLTLKAAHRRRAVIRPRGKDDAAAFLFSRADLAEEAIHDLNFVGLVVRGGGGQFIKSEGGATYSVYNVYLADLELADLFMGVYSGLHSHDWTLDRAYVHDSRWSHAWYKMGWHHTVQRSTFKNGSHDDVALRGYYPDGEKHTYIPDPDDPSCHGNIYVTDRKNRRGFLAPDDWSHLIRNNRFLGWEMHNPQRSRWNVHLALAYGIYEGDADCGAEKVYLPPQNVEIYGNTFSNRGQPEDAHTDAIQIDAWGGLETDHPAAIHGVFVHDNVFEREREDEAFLRAGYGDPDLSKVHAEKNRVVGP